MRPRDLLEMLIAKPDGVVTRYDLQFAMLHTLVSIDDRLARMEGARRQQQENAAAVIASMAGPSVPLSALAEPAFDPLRDCEQDVEDIERTGLENCPECGEPRDAHRERSFGEPPDQPGSDAT